ncbi:YigZ family protein [Enterococcus cecorum]|uniref:YigZ family protein n=1 Tax=Enterococcus cecorum TaxID=44008 RepID=A0AAW8TPT0_9ENTE|nr:YigZ family protein [Enterococcus cecorum]MDT2797210.1 YigZ family protein [Enterococcus cecorum]MDZ5572842.1 YigZ family protein [Enterococcus cecorum]MDZ5589342.1 YigZ family protein [Enterococcus cecorum]
MKEAYFTIYQNGEHQIEIKKSKFICHLFRIENEEQAKEYIAKIKKEHYKANHNCSAYMLGENFEIQRSSDDGEPSGTAGVPILEVLKKNQLQNTLAIVTRYFGGIKLGAGGLIRAYSTSVSEALKEIGIVQGKLQQILDIIIDYPQLGKLQNYLKNEQIAIQEIDYLEQITVKVAIDINQCESFQNALIDLFNNQLSIQILDQKYVENLI